MVKRFVALLVAFAALFIIFWTLRVLWPGAPQQRTFRRGFVTDCLYWFWTPLVTRAVTPVAVAIALLPFAMLFGMSLKELIGGHGSLAKQPLLVQGMEVFVLGDFLGYWQHRMFHRRALWRFHAIHHSSTELDWLSSVRLHPVNDALSRLMVALPLVFAGFNTSVVAFYAPFTTFYAILVHANVSWDYGPLRFVFASPSFHRWHHTSADEGQDKNFAGALPFWDLLFGTFYMPRRQPIVFGTKERIRENLLAHLIFPFRTTNSASRLLASRPGTHALDTPQLANAQPRRC